MSPSAGAIETTVCVRASSRPMTSPSRRAEYCAVAGVPKRRVKSVKVAQDFSPAMGRGGRIAGLEPISKMGTAFGRRCIPAGCVARRSHMADILPPRALPAGRLAALGASPPFLTWVLVGVVWLVFAAAGLAMMSAYANRPGMSAHAPAEWPVRSRLQRDAGVATLVMLAHPRCDCTRASLTELAELMARVVRRPKAFVVFVKPSGVVQDWEHTDLWRMA